MVVRHTNRISIEKFPTGCRGYVLERIAFTSRKGSKTRAGVLPTRYGGPTSELQATVEAGRNVFDFQLTSSE